MYASREPYRCGGGVGGGVGGAKDFLRERMDRTGQPAFYHAIRTERAASSISLDRFHTCSGTVFSSDQLPIPSSISRRAMLNVTVNTRSIPVRLCVTLFAHSDIRRSHGGCVPLSVRLSVCFTVLLFLCLRRCLSARLSVSVFVFVCLVFFVLVLFFRVTAFLMPAFCQSSACPLSAVCLHLFLCRPQLRHILHSCSASPKPG